MSDPMPRLMTKRAQEVAEALEGTCDSLEQHATEEEMDDDHFCSELDAHVFLCEGCGWWWEVGAMSDDDFYCMECRPDAVAE